MKATDYIRRELYLLRHRGHLMICPFCGYHAGKLMSIGTDSEPTTRYDIIGAGRRDERCLRCGAHDRERLLYAYLFLEMKIKERPHLDVLHIAPELGLTKLLRKLKNIRYDCGDLFTPGYEYPDYVQDMNVLDLKQPDNSYDLVLCNHVLEHIEDDCRAMAQFYRVLRPGGIAILQVPISSVLEKTIEDFTVQDEAERIRRFGQYDHCRVYGHDYVDRLQSVGFEVEIVPPLAAKYPRLHLNPKESIYVCHKG